MTIKRIRYALSDTGTVGDTGYLNGEIQMLRWYPAHDTGASMKISLYPSVADTGHGFLVWTDTGHLREQWTVFPRREAASHLIAGEILPSDTGVTLVPIVGAGDRLHVQIFKKKAGSTIGGTLYVYYRE